MSAEIAGARWRVDGGEWRESGETVTLASGEHTVSFEEVDSGIWGCFKPWIGWRPPPDVDVTITSGETTPVTGTYTRDVKASATGAAPYMPRKATGDFLLASVMAAWLLPLRGNSLSEFDRLWRAVSPTRRR